MGVNNINFFEQHVEKIVLAVAAVGAVAMGYLAFQPITITIKDRVIKPDGVEAYIHEELEHLETLQAGLPKPEPRIRNYLDSYNKLAAVAPLDASIVGESKTALAGFPQFGPKNVQPQSVNSTPEGGGLASVTPDPVGALFLHAEARQDQVAAVPLDPANPPPPGMQIQTRTQNSVVIDGYIPVGRMLIQMLQEKDKGRLTSDVQRALVYRIAVERREQTSNGWSDWAKVAPTKAAPAPSDVNFGVLGEITVALDTADGEFKQIVIPDFYPDGLGVPIPPPILSRGMPAAVDVESKKLQTEIDTLKSATSGFRPIAPIPGAPGVPGAPVLPVPATLPADLPSLKSLPIIPFTFWDETVQSNHTYQYRVEVQEINPTYGWKWGLKDEKKKTVSILSTGKMVIQQPITVHADIAFFIRVGGIGDANGISGLIFKQDNGKWYMGEFSAMPGQNIAAIIPLVDQGSKTLEVDTGFAVVDAIQKDGARVILKDPAGNLISKDAAAEWNNPDRSKLVEQAQKRVVGGAPPAIDPVTGMPVVTPTATPTGTPAPAPVYTPPATTPRPPTSNRVPVR